MTVEEQIDAARRELRMRRRVYPRLVTDGRMTQKKADHEIAAMEAIVATLESLQPSRTTQPALI